MNYTIQPKVPGAYSIEVRSTGRRWLVEVQQAREGDLLVQAFGLAEPPAHLIEGDVLTHTVGYWFFPLDTGPDAVAERVTALLKTLERTA